MCVLIVCAMSATGTSRQVLSYSASWLCPTSTELEPDRLQSTVRPGVSELFHPDRRKDRTKLPATLNNVVKQPTNLNNLWVRLDRTARSGTNSRCFLVFGKPQWRWRRPALQVLSTSHFTASPRSQTQTGDLSGIRTGILATTLYPSPQGSRGG